MVPAIDFPNQLAEEFLQVTDRFSMAHSIEARVPFLDHELVELVMQIPSEMRVGTKHPKEFLRETIEDLLPTELVHAKKKGFVLPLKEWTRGKLSSEISELLSEEHLRSQGLFNPDLHSKLVKPHLSGDKDHTDHIWNLFMFQKWAQTFN